MRHPETAYPDPVEKPHQRLADEGKHCGDQNERNNGRKTPDKKDNNRHTQQRKGKVKKPVHSIILEHPTNNTNLHENP